MLDGELRAPLAAAALKDLLPGRGSGTSEEPVGRRALLLLGLVGALRHLYTGY